MRACIQCGLSIGEAATFCPVCGARFEAGAVAVAAGAPAGPAPVLAAEPATVDEPEVAPLDESSGIAAGGREAVTGAAHGAGLRAVLVLEPETRPGAAPGSVFDTDPDLSPAELVADLAIVPKPDRAVASEALEYDGAVVVSDRARPVAAAAGSAGGALVVDEPEAGPESAEPSAPEGPSVPGDAAAETAQHERMTEVSVLLDQAAACEDTDAGRAAALYGDAVVACLEASEDPLGSEDSRGQLLRGFDRLSYVLARDGLWTEALAVVEDAASLGLLDGEDEVHIEGRVALGDRREDLRRILYGDWARIWV